MADREKVIKEWESVLSRDPLDAPWDLIDETLVLLKEQDNCENCAIAIEDRQPIVRCKDCKHYRINTVYPGTNMIMTYCAKTGIAESKPEWFCADGLVKDNCSEFPNSSVGS